MAHIRQIIKSVDKGWHVGRRVEQWRVLLSKHIGEARVAIFYPAEGRGHMGVGRVEKADFMARNWVYQMGQEGTFRVCKSKNQVLDVLSDPRQGLTSRCLGKRGGRKRQVGLKEDALGDKIAAGRVRKPERAYVLFGQNYIYAFEDALFLPETVECSWFWYHVVMFGFWGSSWLPCWCRCLQSLCIFYGENDIRMGDIGGR